MVCHVWGCVCANPPLAAFGGSEGYVCVCIYICIMFIHMYCHASVPRAGSAMSWCILKLDSVNTKTWHNVPCKFCSKPFLVTCIFWSKPFLWQEAVLGIYRVTIQTTRKKWWKSARIQCRVFQVSLGSTLVMIRCRVFFSFQEDTIVTAGVASSFLASTARHQHSTPLAL